jgi:hypothetical protein
MTNISSLLEERFKKSPAAPFLFVGSGLSLRYAGLETWSAMLERFSKYLPKPYDYYRSKANGNLPATAQEIADAFHEAWWSHTDFEPSRAELKGKLDNPSRAFFLKYEIAKYLHSVKLRTGDPAMDAEVELLKAATIDGVITTNWDGMLESIFPDYEVFIGQEPLLFSAAHYVAEIHKIHGCATQASSLVLTKDDYGDFNGKNPYLAAKLLAVFVEHPVIFLGYSISDENITAILRSIAKALSPRNLEKLRDNLIFIQWSTKPPEVESLFMDMDGDKIPLTVVSTNDFGQVYAPLTQLKRRLPARLLRQMKDHVYDLVRTNDPQERLFVVDIENEDYKNIDVVFGVGAAAKFSKVGYRPLGHLDLQKDVLQAKSSYDAKSIVKETLPALTTANLQRGKYLPAFRYLREIGALGDDGTLRDPGNFDAKISELAKREHKDFLPPPQYRGKADAVQKLGSVEAVVSEEGAADAALVLALLRTEQVDQDQLRQYLVANLSLVSKGHQFQKTYFGALIGLYDCLAFKRKR